MKQALLGAAAISAFGYVYFHVHEPKPVTLTATAPVQTPAQFKQLTATELWHLQGECAKLGQAKLEWDQHWSALAWTYTLQTRYRADEGRCYVVLGKHIDADNRYGATPQTREWVWDGQTNDLLAFANTTNGTNNGMVFDERYAGNTLGRDAATVYISTKLGNYFAGPGLATRAWSAARNLFGRGALAAAPAAPSAPIEALKAELAAPQGTANWESAAASLQGGALSGVSTLAQSLVSGATTAREAIVGGFSSGAAMFAGIGAEIGAAAPAFRAGTAGLSIGVSGLSPTGATAASAPAPTGLDTP